MRKWTAVIPVAAAYAFSAAAYSSLPESGTPNLSMLLPVDVPAGGPVSRLAAALLLPTVALAVWVLLDRLAAVRGSVKHLPSWWLNEQTGSAAIERFQPTYSSIAFAVTSLIALAHMAFLGSLLGWPAWTYGAITGVIGLGFVAAGNVMPRVRPNWIVGLRTRKTLSDSQAWSRTHRVLGILMIGVGIVVIVLSVVSPRYALVTGLAALLPAFLVAHALGTRKPSARAASA